MQHEPLLRRNKNLAKSHYFEHDVLSLITKMDHVKASSICDKPFKMNNMKAIHRLQQSQ